MPPRACSPVIWKRLSTSPLVSDGAPAASGFVARAGASRLPSSTLGTTRVSHGKRARGRLGWMIGVGIDDETEVDRVMAVEAEPRNLGRYVLLDRLGAGAMGTVHSAWD